MNPAKLLRTSTFRLALVYMGLFAGSVLVLLGFIYWSTVAFMANQIDVTIKTEITGLAEQYIERGLNGLVRTVTERLERDPDSSSVYLLTTPNYRPLAGNLSAWPDVSPTADGWINFQYEDPRAGGRVFVARARPFVLQDNLHLLVGRDTRELKTTQQLIIRALLWGLAITLALALVGGIAMSRSMLRRIEQINHTSREIMAGDLSQRVPSSGTSDEFDQLADNLNSMLDDIQNLMEGVRHVSDNIAHDLRTPLTRLRNRLEQLRTEFDRDSPHLEHVERTITDADQLLATFAALLRIARIESGGHKVKLTQLDLSILLQDVIDLYGVLADERQIVITKQVPDTVYIDGDRDLIFQALANLLDNGVKYTPEGGCILLTASRENHVTELSVADSGPGIPTAEHDKVKQRFYRLERSRSTPGSGLGLSLVAAVAKLHHAQLLLVDNAPGLKVTLRFDTH